MKKTLIGLGIAVLFACAVPAFAQGSFSDVPTDHWAYDAVNKLQADGLVVGYPDGTFSGKRSLTRFEFAAALARLIPVLEERLKGAGGVGPAGPKGEKGEKGEPGPAGCAGPAGSEADIKALQQLVNEFRDELAGIGVDVDAMKRDIAGLAARVDVIERRMNQFRWGLDLNAFGVATATESSSLTTPFDRDGRALRPVQGTGNDLINATGFVRDADLTLTSSLTPSFAALVDINFGNYISSYEGGIVTDYDPTERIAALRSIGAGFGSRDAFYPYYMYGEAGFCYGSFKFGRIPVQYTPYTLKMIDIDSYTVNDKLDSGNYPLDGAQATYRWGNVNLNGFAAKTDMNTVLGTGLVSHSTSGLYSPFRPGVLASRMYTPEAGSLQPNGPGIGGLNQVSQVAGARASIGTPFKGTLGVTYLQAAGDNNANLVSPLGGYDTVEVWGADLKAEIAKISLYAEYAQSKIEDSVQTPGQGVNADINFNNAAFDGKAGYSWGKLHVDLGYKQIGNNFGAPGFWDKVGMWTNPVNIKGPYGDISYALWPSVNLIGTVQDYKGNKDLPPGFGLPLVINDTDDEILRAVGGLKWGFSAASNLGLGWEYIEWKPSGGVPMTTEQYINIGLGTQLNPNTGVNLSYQIIDYKPGATTAANTPYGNLKYKGGVAIAQIKSKF